MTDEDKGLVEELLAVAERDCTSSLNKSMLRAAASAITRLSPTGMSEKRALEALDMACGLIQEAKGLGGDSVVDHLDAAENWIDKARAIRTASTRTGEGDAVEVEKLATYYQSKLAERYKRERDEAREAAPSLAAVRNAALEEAAAVAKGYHAIRGHSSLWIAATKTAGANIASAILALKSPEPFVPMPGHYYPWNPPASEPEKGVGETSCLRCHGLGYIRTSIYGGFACQACFGSGLLTSSPPPDPLVAELVEALRTALGILNKRGIYGPTINGLLAALTRAKAAMGDEKGGEL